MTGSPTLDTATGCPIHGEMDWEECQNCDEGFTHDCGEDMCLCADPEPNVRCSACKGKGGFLRCFGCYPDED